jgi:hypothetical protein
MRDKRLDNRATAPHEMVLIRVGHHLWRAWKASRRQDKALFAALETVWAAKEAVRVDLRKEWLEHYRNRSERLAKYRITEETLGDA